MKKALDRYIEIVKSLSNERPFLLYLLIVVIVFWPLSFGIYALQYDAIDVYLPWRFYGSESLRQGITPLWNPFQDAGYPMYADHQYSIWNPELFLVSTITRYNALLAQWLYILYLTLAGVGFRFLLKQLNLNSKVWFIGGILYMLSGIMIGHAQSPVSILGAVWLPWALGSYIKAYHSNYKWRDVIGVVIFMYLMLSSGYQAVSIMLFYVVLVIGIMYFVTQVRLKDWKRLKRLIAGHLFIVIGLLALMLGIVLSLREVFPFLTRLSGLTLEETQLISFNPNALWSMIYPLASVQEEYAGTSATTQNIFQGSISILFLLVGFKYIWSKRTPELIILYVFAALFGIAAFGGLTPIQPLLVKYLPGCDQFYYAVFYRYFAWIIVVIITCLGLQQFLDEGKAVHLKWFLIIPLIIYLLSMLVYSNDWSGVFSVFNDSWSVNFRELGWNKSVLLQSIIQAAVLIGLLLYVIIKKPKVGVIIPMMIVELMVISQLNLPVTVHGEYKTDRIDRYLAQFKEGFNIPSNEEPLLFYENYKQYVPIYRNQGNFTNYPKLSSWTSFYLKGRKPSKFEDELQRSTILSRPLAYTVPVKSEIEFLAFNPNYLKLKVDAHVIRRQLVLQQANYLHWKAYVNGREMKISSKNDFLRTVNLPNTASIVEFKFENKAMSAIYYITMFGFVALLFIYIGTGELLFSTRTNLVSFAGVFVIIGIRYLMFSPTPSEGYEFVSGNKKLKISTGVTSNELSRIYNWIHDKQELSVSRRNSDFDGPTYGLLRYHYNSMNGSGEGWKCSSIRKRDTLITQLDRNNQFSDEVSLSELVKERKHWKDHVVFGFQIHGEWQTDSVLVGMVVKRGTETIDYMTKPTNVCAKSDKDTLCTGSFLLPPIEEDEDIRIWIWNMGHKKFSFSNFRVEMFEE